ncbi:MAG: hypothetical protein EBZ77_11800 [Chitinophagia bacterium]|nr:hypothetical protein [Chitinophagia bacterium]
MRSLLSILSVWLLLTTTVVGSAYAKKCKHKPFIQGIELGFYGKSELGFSTHKPAQLRFTPPSLFVRLPLYRRLKAEVCINREQFFSQLNHNSNKNNLLQGLNGYHVSVPVSIQYYFLNPSSRIRPFVGVGGWLFATPNSGNPGANDEQARINNGYRGPNFISVFYTQGFTIEVNTHLQVTQSIHLYNLGSSNNVEMTFGIGYRLP